MTYSFLVPNIWGLTQIFPTFSRKCPETTNLAIFTISNGAKMGKINRPWLKSNQFWRWSGYISMPNLRPFLQCVLKKMQRKQLLEICRHRQTHRWKVSSLVGQLGNGRTDGWKTWKYNASRNYRGRHNKGEILQRVYKALRFLINKVVLRFDGLAKCYIDSIHIRGVTIHWAMIWYHSCQPLTDEIRDTYDNFQGHLGIFRDTFRDILGIFRDT